MTIHRFLSAGLLIATLLPSAVHAQLVDPPNDPSCVQDLYAAFGREHRLARAVLFGTPSAERAPITSVFYDEEGNPWVKTDDDAWKSPADDNADDTWPDARMDDMRERDLLCRDNENPLAASCVTLPRRGIFEIKKTPTSDLIHPIVQTVRALQCRLRAVCDVASESPGKERGDTITIEIDGCLPMTYPVMEGCRELTSTASNTLPGNCQAARRELVQREMQLLRLTVSYDASYRSLAQFAGMFQEFLTQFRLPLIEPIWQMVRAFGGLQGIPCFQAECNE